jgi:spore germination cell wall hydrolase CwlJ-like protein
MAGERTMTKIMIIAMVIAAEAVGEGPKGMVAVANVIANRARRSGQSAYEEVVKPKQFFGLTAPNRMKLLEQCGDYCIELAENIMTLPDITGGATHYENVNKYGTPNWARRMTLTFEYKHHKFYKEKK